MPGPGLILYAHGARDPRWAEPFERLLSRLRERRPDLPAMLAYLEHMSPNLTAAARALASRGIDRVRIVPLFFGRGGHLREDFPLQVEAARAAVPGVAFEIVPAAGEDPAIIEALADFALDSFV
jgi:sirohydrochlorin cobaltochelatase